MPPIRDRWVAQANNASFGAQAAYDELVPGFEALFEREGLNVSVTNVWRVEVDPAGTPQGKFAYQLTRRPPSDRLFRVEFDFARPIAPPPAPWGH